MNDVNSYDTSNLHINLQNNHQVSSQYINVFLQDRRLDCNLQVLPSCLAQTTCSQHNEAHPESSATMSHQRPDELVS